MINLKGVTKRFGPVTVYENFSCSFEDGKIRGILGESGSGKTTLLNMIASLTPYDGEIDRVRCSYIFQEPRLVPSLTVWGNLKLVCKDGDRIEAFLGKAGIGDRRDSYPYELSGGQARRVSLVRAFLYDADAVLLDEPFSSLDLKTKLEMMRLFASLQRDTGCPAVFVTHDADEAVMLSHSVSVLRDGTFSLTVPIPGEPVRSFGDCEKEKHVLISELLR